MKNTRNIYHYQIRRCRRVEEYLINQKIIENSIDNDKDLFEEIKKQRRTGINEDLVIDGASSNKIPEKFADVYEKLFNRENDGEVVNNILGDINDSIDEESKNVLQKINIMSIKDPLSLCEELFHDLK